MDGALPIKGIRTAAKKSHPCSKVQRNAWNRTRASNEPGKETFRKVGNILIGDRIGKTAELPGDVISIIP